MNAQVTNSVLCVCVAAVFIVGLTQCGVRTNPEEVKAIAEACAKLGKEPSITARSTDGIRMGCIDSFFFTVSVGSYQESP